MAIEKPIYYTYDKERVIYFFKPTERYGWLANFAPDFTIRYQESWYRTSEHLYQALKHKDRKVKSQIIATPYPKTAKEISAKRAPREDWEEIKVDVMRFVLRMKVYNNWDRFTALALQDGLFNKYHNGIVEVSYANSFWGCIPYNNGRKCQIDYPNAILMGQNIFGRLWMELIEGIVRGKITKDTEPKLIV